MAFARLMGWGQVAAFQGFLVAITLVSIICTTRRRQAIIGR